MLTLASWLVRDGITRRLKIFTGALFWPVMIFLAFTLFGLAYGLGTGGSVNVGLWKARPIIYFIVTFFLASNLLRKREHVQQLLWLAMTALFIVAITGDLHYLLDLKGNLTGIKPLPSMAPPFN